MAGISPPGSPHTQHTTDAARRRIIETPSHDGGDGGEGAHFFPPTISRTTFPVMNARFAGRSARRRMRYGYHCVPNGT
jgi:hypothetical protein